MKYHIVWVTKYRKDVLVGKVEQRLKEMIYEIAERSDITIEGIECDKDHIHLLVECRPQHYIPTIIKDMKGCSARFLFKEFPELKSKLWGGHLWNPSYFVVTISEDTEQQVREYIRNQKKK